MNGEPSKVENQEQDMAAFSLSTFIKYRARVRERERDQTLKPAPNDTPHPTVPHLLILPKWTSDCEPSIQI